jgi:23S rRNA pseudouridine2605 synthase
MRLAKFLAHAGVASRRAAEAIVAEGRVTVDGEVVTDPARDVDETSGVALDGRRVAPEPHEVHALNKPAGVVSTARDTHGRPTVVELVRSPRRLYPVGRLDADTTGLILLTNDGELADRLTHPRYGVKKVYRARIQPARLSPRALEALREGVELEDGRTAPAGVRQPAAGVLELTIREGRKRQVRRMVEAVGHRVVELERVAFGPLGLRGLEPGKSRRLTKAEVARLRGLSEPRSGRPPRGRAPGARAKPARGGAAKAPSGGSAKPRGGAAKPARGGGAKPARGGPANPRDRAGRPKPEAAKPRARRRPQR